MNEPRAIRHVIVRGRVQGVGFRAFVEDQAIRRRLEGWVRNRKDGSVEALLAGSRRAVEDMVEVCRVGPPSCRVDALDQREAVEAELAAGRPGSRFSVLPTT